MTETSQRAPGALSCPSGSAEDRHARIFGIVGGRADAPTVTYLAHPVRVTPGLIERLDGVSPAEVFRVVSPCAEAGCKHFAEGECGIARRVAELPAVAHALPPCSIRATCRWFAERHGAACLRCPQVVTLTPKSDAREPVRRRLPLL